MPQRLGIRTPGHPCSPACIRTSTLCPRPATNVRCEENMVGCTHICIRRTTTSINFSGGAASRARDTLPSFRSRSPRSHPPSGRRPGHPRHTPPAA
jgi:hypothetical protein